MLTLYIQRRSPLPIDTEAAGPLAALGRALSSANRAGQLWARCQRALVPFDAGTVELLLTRERALTGDPVRPTHVLSLCATAEGPGEVGVILVNVRPDPPPDAAHGLTLSLSLSHEVFDITAESLQRLLERVIEAVSPDIAIIGPSTWVRDHAAGWATFARRLGREALSPDAAMIPARSGTIVIAHREDPASESASAHDAIKRVREALNDPPQAIQAVSRTEATVPSTSAAPPAAPRYVRPPPELSGPLDVASLPLPPAAPLPFVATPQPKAPSPTLPRYVRPPSELSGTIDVAALPAPNRPALPFGAPDADLAVPELTLEQYASLRAHLAVRGEEDTHTWRRFGVASRDVKEALQARFAAQFRGDPAAQTRFVQLVQQRLAELRAR